MDENKLIEKLRRIEALYAGTTILESELLLPMLGSVFVNGSGCQSHNDAVEYKFSMVDMWSRKLFLPC